MEGAEQLWGKDMSTSLQSDGYFLVCGGWWLLTSQQHDKTDKDNKENNWNKNHFTIFRHNHILFFCRRFWRLPDKRDNGVNQDDEDNQYYTIITQNSHLKW